MASAHKPHAVFVPAPAQSHIKVLLMLAKLFHHKGFHITFVNTEFNDRRFLRARGSEYSLKEFSDFRFECIPDGLPPSESDATQDFVPLCQSILTFMLAPFCKLLSKLNDDKDIPPLNCIVSDAFMPFTAKASEEFGIPLILCLSNAACSFMGFYQFPTLLEKGLAPLPEESCLENGYLDTKVDWIPGLMKDMCLKDLPTLFRTTDKNDILLNNVLECMGKVSQASAIVIHTFDALEIDVLDAFSRMFSHVYAVGPLELLLNRIPDYENNLKSIGYNLLKEETDCLQWLDSKEPNSVVYVSFGSIVVLSPQQLVELCWGLAYSKCNFLWIIRPDLVSGDKSILPSEFLVQTKERGLISGWCPQEQVLNHSSIGGFLTHCGWNSIIESLSAGVPMLCCPFVADQPINCKYVCYEWGFGLEIDNNANRDEVKTIVRKLINGEESKKLRNKALEWKKVAEIAASPTASK